MSSAKPVSRSAILQKLPAPEQLAVWLDDPAFGPLSRIGTLSRSGLDSDRWGQVLMKRRELVEAKAQGRTRRELRAWDFLIGVQDITRMGALRFSAADDSVPPVFLANEALSAPPVSQLGAAFTPGAHRTWLSHFFGAKI